MPYDIAFLIFCIFYLPALAFRGRMHAGFGERFGRYPEEKRRALARSRDTIWIQAVSVGEVALCRSLIPALRKAFPSSGIVLSTITRTGNELAERLFSGDATIIYFPLDLSRIADAVVGMIRPKLYIMLETEIWPNVLRAVRGSGASSVLLNGRISDRSYGKYLLARPFLKGTLGLVDRFCMQSETDADRIKAMGAPADRVSVTGTMKFDTADAAAAQDGPGLSLAPGEDLLVAASTHPGEEEMLLGIYKRLAAGRPTLRLLIAPRHVERSKDVERLVRRFGLVPARLSSPGPALRAESGTVLILDTIGRLGAALSRSTVVFVGGSLVRHGGQNPLEAAALGKSIVFGPHMFNFRGIVDALLKNDAAVQASDAEDLFGKISALLDDGNRRRDLGWNAKRALAANRGATARNLAVIMGTFPKGTPLRAANT